MTTPQESKPAVPEKILSEEDLAAARTILDARAAEAEKKPESLRPPIDAALVQKVLDAVDATKNRPIAGVAIASAISRVQGAIRSIGKDRDVEVETQKGGKYTFRYATLSAIWDSAGEGAETLRKALRENDLAVFDFPKTNIKEGTVSVLTRVIHAPSAEWVENTLELPLGTRRDPQGIGAVITYARRYNIAALIGVTQTDENEEEALTYARDDYSQVPPPQSTQRPAAPSKPQPPRQAPKSNGPPIAYAELEQQMKSCTSKTELSKVAAKAKDAGLSPKDRGELLSLYKATLKVLETGGGAA